MSDETITRRSLADRRRGHTDWARVDATTDGEIDAQIDAQIAADADTAPALDAEWFRTADILMPPDAGKEAVSLRLDGDVLAWFRNQGSGYQTRMNAVLRAYVHHKKAAGG